MTTIPDAQLTHVGIYVRNLQVMKTFYCENLGMVVSDEGVFNGREMAFLTRTENEHHQMVMICDPSRQLGESSLGQISFRVQSLQALREFYSLLAKKEAKGLEGRNHGNSWSFYFFDPDDNKIEVYVPTPWHVSQPWRAPLDLTESPEKIEADTIELVRSLQGWLPMNEWSHTMRGRIEGGL